MSATMLPEGARGGASEGEDVAKLRISSKLNRIGGPADQPVPAPLLRRG